MAIGDSVKRVYSNFRGADFRGEEVNLKRSPDCLNVWKDYKETESIRTRPGMELLHSFKDTVYGVFFYTVGDTEMMIVHSGGCLYRVTDSEPEIIFYPVNQAKSSSFVYNDTWYFIDGKNYLRYDGIEVTIVDGYVPTTSIGRSPTGEVLNSDNVIQSQDVNLLSDLRINTFVGDGSSTVYHLDCQDIDESAFPEVFISGEEVLDFTVNYKKGTVTFATAPAKPKTDGQDNVSIRFAKKSNRSLITKCTLIELFDNRVFFSGNPEHPNVIWHCSLNDPTYCSDLDYYNEGLDSAMVKGLVAGHNALWVFKKGGQGNTNVFYHVPTIDSEEGKIYPNTHSNISAKCVGGAINFNDDIVFFSDRGMEGLSGDITTEQAISHRSTVVDRKLIAEADYKDMILVEWEGYLVVIIGNKAYLADSRATFTNENHYEYEWFYWELEKDITCAKVNNGVLYLGTSDGVYSLTDLTSNVVSFWVTPKDKFKHPQYVKTTNKRGCVVEATGDISFYAMTEKSKDFEFIGSYENIEDYFVSRIKCKKFKDIQLKFYSNTRFSLETATLESFIGGYIKR